ncbi:hypothetical protein COL940_013125 [Colletotrichum noveboracense]|nr:hypothetical protein COL940_013125 [Colletotrichum noveboracense]
MFTVTDIPTYRSMMVRVHESGGDDLASAVDKFRINWGSNALSNPGDPVVPDKDIGIPCHGLEPGLISPASPEQLPRSGSVGPTILPQYAA